MERHVYFPKPRTAIAIPTSYYVLDAIGEWVAAAVYMEKDATITDVEVFFAATGLTVSSSCKVRLETAGNAAGGPSGTLLAAGAESGLTGVPDANGGVVFTLGTPVVVTAGTWFWVKVESVAPGTTHVGKDDYEIQGQPAAWVDNGAPTAVFNSFRFMVNTSDEGWLQLLGSGYPGAFPFGQFYASPQEVAWKITPKAAMSIAGVWLSSGISFAAVTHTLTLYDSDGLTVLAQMQPPQGVAYPAASQQGVQHFPFTNIVDLAANTDYYIGLTASGSGVYSKPYLLDASRAAAQIAGLELPVRICSRAVAGTGAWTETDATQPAGVLLEDVTTGDGGTGGTGGGTGGGDRFYEDIDKVFLPPRPPTTGTGAADHTINALSEATVLVTRTEEGIDVGQVVFKARVSNGAPIATVRIETVDSDGNPTGTLVHPDAWTNDIALSGGAFTIYEASLQSEFLIPANTRIAVVCRFEQGDGAFIVSGTELFGNTDRHQRLKSEITEWTPDEIATVAWYDADDASTVKMTEFNLLDLSVTNPSTGLPFAPGDKYRLMFVSSTNRTAESTDIADYNSFVQALAAAAGYGSINWYAIGSTAAVDARDNANLRIGVDDDSPILLIDGKQILANNLADLWDGTVRVQPDLDENGNLRAKDTDDWTNWVGVWTGSQNDGTAQAGAELGQSTVQAGIARGELQYWINRGGGAIETNTLNMAVYAVSEVLTVGTEVNEWRDKSGNDRHMVDVPAGPATNPHWRDGSQINGRDVMHYTDTYDQLAVTIASLDLTEFCILGVGMPKAAGDYPSMGAIYKTDLTDRIDARLQNDGVDGKINHSFVLDGVSTPIASSPDDTSIRDDVPFILALWYDGAEAVARTDGGLVSKTVDVADGATFTIDTIQCGRYSNTPRNYHGEYIILPTSDLATIEKVEGYLAWKWGTVDKLPPAHPYKSEAPSTGVVNYARSVGWSSLGLGSSSNVWHQLDGLAPAVQAVETITSAEIWHGAVFDAPATMKVSGLWFHQLYSGSYEMLLYDSNNNLLANTPLRGAEVREQHGPLWSLFENGAEVTLEKDESYKLIIHNLDTSQARLMTHGSSFEYMSAVPPYLPPPTMDYIQSFIEPAPGTIFIASASIRPLCGVVLSSMLESTLVDVDFSGKDMMYPQPYDWDNATDIHGIISQSVDPAWSGVPFMAPCDLFLSGAAIELAGVSTPGDVQVSLELTNSLGEPYDTYDSGNLFDPNAVGSASFSAAGVLELSFAATVFVPKGTHLCVVFRRLSGTYTAGTILYRSAYGLPFLMYSNAGLEANTIAFLSAALRAVNGDYVYTPGMAIGTDSPNETLFQIGFANEVGIRLKSEITGTICGVWYAAALNDQVHQVALYDENDTLLAQTSTYIPHQTGSIVFASFASGVRITAGSYYRIEVLDKGTGGGPGYLINVGMPDPKYQGSWPIEAYGSRRSGVGGTWTEHTDYRCFAGFMMESVSAPTGSAGFADLPLSYYPMTTQRAGLGFQGTQFLDAAGEYVAAACIADEDLTFDTVEIYWRSGYSGRTMNIGFYSIDPLTGLPDTLLEANATTGNVGPSPATAGVWSNPLLGQITIPAGTRFIVKIEYVSGGSVNVNYEQSGSNVWKSYLIYKTGATPFKGSGSIYVSLPRAGGGYYTVEGLTPAGVEWISYNVTGSLWNEYAVLIKTADAPLRAWGFYYRTSGDQPFIATLYDANFNVIEEIEETTEARGAFTGPLFIPFATSRELEPNTTYHLAFRRNGGAGNSFFYIKRYLTADYRASDWNVPFTIDEFDLYHRTYPNAFTRFTGVAGSSDHPGGGVLDAGFLLDGVARPVATSTSLDPILVAGPSTGLDFDAVEAGPNPDPQRIIVLNGGEGTLYWVIDDLGFPSWLSVDKTSGISTGATEVDEVLVSIDITGLSEGTYNHSIVVDAGTVGSVVIPVELVVADADPSIGHAPLGIAFASLEGVDPDDEVLGVFNDGGQTLNWTITSYPAWLTPGTLAGSSTGPTDVTDVNLVVDTTGLADGIYNGNIRIEAVGADDTPVDVPVSLTLVANPPVIGYGPTSLDFTAKEEGSNPASQEVAIWNAGGLTLDYDIVSVGGASWLTGLPDSGSLTPGNTDRVTIGADITGLSGGVYNETVRITAADAPNSPVDILVTLTVEALDPEHIQLSTDQVSLLAIDGDAYTSPFEVAVWNSGDKTINWSLSKNESWLLLVPTGGVSAGEVDRFEVKGYVDGLAPGVYTDVIEVAAPEADNTPQTIDVTLVVREKEFYKPDPLPPGPLPAPPLRRIRDVEGIGVRKSTDDQSS
jgi:hypothetical protein